MTQYIISVYSQWKNFKMVVNIGNQPTVSYSHLSFSQVLKFIKSHNEFISVKAIDKEIRDELIKNIKDNNIMIIT